MASYLRPRRGKKSTALSQNIVLKRGEVFFEVPNEGVGTGKGRIIMGDGTHTYDDLKDKAFLESFNINADDTLIAFTNTSSPDADPYAKAANPTYLENFDPGNSVKTLFTNLKKLLVNYNSQLDKLNNEKAKSSESGYSLAVSGTTVKLLNKAGTELSKITTQDTNTTYGTASTSSAGLLRALNGSTSNYLRGDGNWVTPPNNNNYPYLGVGLTSWSASLASGTATSSVKSFTVSKPALVGIYVSYPSNKTGSRGLHLYNNGAGSGQGVKISASQSGKTELFLMGYLPGGTGNINCQQDSGSTLSISGYYLIIYLY